MNNITYQFFSFLQLCSKFLKARTPTIITCYNLNYILKQNKTQFKPKLKFNNILGNRRYFWEFFNKYCIEWRYRKYEGRVASSCNQELLPMLKSLLSSKMIPNWLCEIQTITNVSSSKSLLSEFTNLNDLVLQDSQDLISEITLENLSKNMRHYESKIFHVETEIVSCELWSKTFTWHNTGGSHHFAAARYIANELGKEVKLTVNLELTYLDEEQFHSLFSKYEIFIISNRDVIAYQMLFETLLNSKIPFITAPIDTYFSHDEDYSSLRLFAFYRSEKTSHLIIEIFKHSSALNLYDYFHTLISQQTFMIKELENVLPPIVYNTIKY
ncbi:DUF6685 family protein [Rodentibacter myodis]|uniref:Uncharacterized protein n=1 Tax=Rodentibacter myodis TaxID=1907939 RepID=A0A1V3JSS2_9PAST|nr:DUF6685 family protein [Rodentibacter myodis]OOF59707.1 hypothetical protein BKL49_02650 [Rodentibacter myodis]